MLGHQTQHVTAAAEFGRSCITRGSPGILDSVESILKDVANLVKGPKLVASFDSVRGRCQISQYSEYVSGRLNSCWTLWAQLRLVATIFA